MATPEGARFCLMASIISRQTSTLVRTSLGVLPSCTVCAFDRSTWLKGILLQRKFAGSPESTHRWATQNLQDHLKVPTSGLLKIYRIPRKYPPVGYSKTTLLVSHFWHSYDLENWVMGKSMYFISIYIEFGARSPMENVVKELLLLLLLITFMLPYSPFLSRLRALACDSTRAISFL